MPELPEVETVVRELRPHVIGRRITAVKVGKQSLRLHWSRNWAGMLLGRRIEEIRRRGKWICLHLDQDGFLIVHLGMTGQFYVRPAAEPLLKHTHIVFGLDDDQRLRFRDIRRFGSVQLIVGASAVEQFFTDSRLGPEPFDLKPGYWRDRLTTTSRSLKAALLDQRLVAGVGNIYADESLYEARLPPTQLGRATQPAEAERLRRAIVKVLRRAIEYRGSSIRNYVGGSGLKGAYQNEFRVYGRTGQPCRRCQVPIERIRLGGRSTHFCPQCQHRVTGDG